MKVYYGAITTMAARGRLSLHIPDIAVGTPMPEMIDRPDEWFIRCVIRGGNHPYRETRPLTSKDSYAMLYLSKKGYEANKDALRMAFNSVYDRGHTWADFEAYAEMFYAELRNPNG